MVSYNKNANGFYRDSFEPRGTIEGSGSSSQVGAEMAAFEKFDTSMRKCIKLSSNVQCDSTSRIPTQVLPLSIVSHCEKDDLIQKLRFELEQIRTLIKKIDTHRVNVTLSSSSDILSCNNGTNLPKNTNVNRTAMVASAPRKKLASSRKYNGGWSRTQKPNHVKDTVPPNSTSVALMKQCETLLNRLMSHQHGWVFNSPVDVVKLNIPDYLNIIKHPMDLGTIKSKLLSGIYSSPWEFASDVRLTFMNALEYNPKGHMVHSMANALNKFFESRWKLVERKISNLGTQTFVQSERSRPLEEIETPVAKKRKLHTFPKENAKHMMTDMEKQNLGRELEALLGEIPDCIINFLKENSSRGNSATGDEIVIDIDVLSDDVLFTLRRLLDDYVREKQKIKDQALPCEIELLNESGLSNSSPQQPKENDQVDEDMQVGGKAHGLDAAIVLGGEPGASPTVALNIPRTPSSSRRDNQANKHDSLKELPCGTAKLEETYQRNPSLVEAERLGDGDRAPSERQVSPEKLYRAALLKNRFADAILKAREKTLPQSDRGDPEKLRREREELELQKKREKAKLQAEAKAAEEARRRAEAAEARKKRELEREAARQALLKMEKTVEINENSGFLQDLEMLRSAHSKHVADPFEAMGSDQVPDELGGLVLGCSNPLEQLGLFMKADEEEEDGEPLRMPKFNLEEGEID